LEEEEEEEEVDLVVDEAQTVQEYIFSF